MAAPECPRCSGAGVVGLYDERGRYLGTATCGRCGGSGVAR